MKNIFTKIDKQRFYSRMGQYSFWFMVAIALYGLMTGDIRWHPEWFYAAWLAYFFLYFGVAWFVGTRIKSRFKQLIIAYAYVIAGGIFLLW